MSSARGVRRVARWLALVLLLAVVGACTRIPTSGPVESAEGPTQAPEVSVEVAAEPPVPGASPRMVVEGYLQAMAGYQQGYGVARLYLASDVRENWRPEARVTVYEDGYGVTSTAESATLEAPLVGVIQADGSFSHRSEQLVHDFRLGRDVDGQWRIRNPPEGLLVSRYLFDKFYQPVNLYFYDPTWTTIVPDPIVLQSGNRTPTALLQGLLRGPTDWLGPVVVSAIPAQTRLNVQSAYADDHGVVEVSLNESVAALADEQRSRMAAQVTWTLSQIDGITGVRFLMNGAPYAVPEAREGVVGIQAFDWLDRTPAGQRPPTTYGATETGLVTVTDGAGGAEILPLPGPLGGLAGVEAIEVSQAQDRIAVVLGDRASVQVSEQGAEPREVASGHGLLRPQFVQSQIGEFWVVGEIAPEHGQQVAVRISAERTDRVALPFAMSRVDAFRISPDGTRMALVRRGQDGRSELGVARINRALPDLVLDGWRTIPLGDAGDPGPGEIVDVGWLDGTSLIVLAAVDTRQPVKPYRVDVNATAVAEIGQPDNWQALAVATAPRTGGGRALVIGRNGVWRYEDDYRWPLVVKGLRAVAYAG